MAFRFRKSIKIGKGFRINLGKKGITSATIGKGPIKANLNKKGVRTSANVPGSGVTFYSQRSNQTNGKTNQSQNNASYKKNVPQKTGCFGTSMALFFSISGILVALSSLAMSPLWALLFIIIIFGVYFTLRPYFNILRTPKKAWHFSAIFFFATFFIIPSTLNSDQGPATPLVMIFLGTSFFLIGYAIFQHKYEEKEDKKLPEQFASLEKHKSKLPYAAILLLVGGMSFFTVLIQTGLTAFGLAEITITPTTDPAIAYTEAAETIIAEYTLNAPTPTQTFTLTPTLTFAPTITPLPTFTKTPSPTRTPVPTPACICNYDYYNCDDQDAYFCYNFCLPSSGDVHQLDRDGDGNACEW